MTPFLAVHGRHPPSLRDYIQLTVDTDSVHHKLLDRQAILTLLGRNLRVAQLKMKSTADKHRKDTRFSPND